MKKALVVLLAVAMVFSFATSAMAFSDISSEKTDTQDAINKFAAYGVIEGYPDGTFLPDGTITRAEFASIVIKYTGNNVLADALKNTPSAFSDVKTGVWYTGPINAAVALGYFEGMGDGTFGISKSVTYGQVVTVMLRLAGYTNDLPGAWPYNYVAQASKEGLVQAATAFDVTAAATRKDVVLIAEKVLGVNTVMYNETTKKFVDDATTTNVKAAYNALKDAPAAALTLGYDAKKGITVNTYALADGYYITDGYTLFDLTGKTGALYFDADGKIAMIDLDGKYVKGVVTAVSTDKKTFTIDGKTYASDAAIDTIVKGNYAEFTLASGKITASAKLTETAPAMIVTKVEEKKISGVQVTATLAEIAIDKDTTYIVIKDNAATDLSAIAVGDLVYARNDIGTAKVYEVFGAVDGAVSSINSDNGTAIASYVVNGVTYTGAPKYMVAGGTALSTMVVDDYAKKDGYKAVAGKFYTDKYGVAVALVYGKAAEAPKNTTVYGYVMAGTIYKAPAAAGAIGAPAGAATTVGFSDITVLNAAGETVKYAIKDYDKENAANGIDLFDVNGNAEVCLKGSTTVIKQYDFVVLTVNPDGAIVDIKAAAANKTATAFDAKLNIISDNAATPVKYNLPGTVAVFNVTTGAKPAVTVSTVADSAAAIKDNAATKVTFGYNATTKAIDFVIITDATVAESTASYAVLETLYAEGTYAKFAGVETLYEKATGFNAGGAVANDIITYTLEGAKVKTFVVKTAATVIAANTAKVAAVSGAVVTMDNNAQYVVNADTAIYLYDNDGKFKGMGTAADIAKDVEFLAGEAKDGVLIYGIVIK